jgi:hypothetical protein
VVASTISVTKRAAKATNNASRERSQTARMIAKTAVKLRVILAASKETPNAIRARLIAANVSGDIDAKVTYFETLIAGLSTLARQGMSRDTLLKVVDTAFIGWPEV